MIKNSYPGKFIVLEGSEGGGKSTQAKLLAHAMEAKGYPVCLTEEPTKDGLFGKLARFMYASKSSRSELSVKALQKELASELDEVMNSRDYLAMHKTAQGGSARNFAEFERIAEIARGNYYAVPVLMQYCFIFDRHDHRVRVEIPALGKGKYVISDRDFLSTLAYGASEGLGWNQLLAMHEEILGNDFIAPDLIFFLDIPPEIGLARTQKKQNGGKDYFDTLEKQKKISNAYFKIMKTLRLPSRIIKIDANRDTETVHQEIMLNTDLFLGGFG